MTYGTGVYGAVGGTYGDLAGVGTPETGVHGFTAVISGTFTVTVTPDAACRTALAPRTSSVRVLCPR